MGGHLLVLRLGGFVEVIVFAVNRYGVQNGKRPPMPPMFGQRRWISPKPMRPWAPRRNLPPRLEKVFGLFLAHKAALGAGPVAVPGPMVTQWVRKGRTKASVEIVDDLENAPPWALIGLVEGRNRGKMAVRLCPRKIIL